MDFYKVLNFHFIYIKYVLFFVETRVSLCSSGCPRISYVDQFGLELRDLSASASLIGIKGICNSIFNLFSNSLLISSDEVGALVFDIGSYTVRAGYAGEDCPKVRTMI
jgi:hypothetical protein